LNCIFIENILEYFCESSINLWVIHSEKVSWRKP
jgi:hypothetical protein